MIRNKFLKIIASMLSTVVLVSGFAATPINAQVKFPSFKNINFKNINLTKNEKIGMGVGIPGGTAVGIGIIVLCKVLHDKSKAKNVVTKNSSDAADKWGDNFWNILIHDLKDDVGTIEWIKQSYPDLESKLSQISAEGDTAAVVRCRDPKLEINIVLPDMRGLLNTGEAMNRFIDWLRNAKEKSQESPHSPLPGLTIEIKKRNDVYGH